MGGGASKYKSNRREEAEDDDLEPVKAEAQDEDSDEEVMHIDESKIKISDAEALTSQPFDPKAPFDVNLRLGYVVRCLARDQWLKDIGGPPPPHASKGGKAAAAAERAKEEEKAKAAAKAAAAAAEDASKSLVVARTRKIPAGLAAGMQRRNDWPAGGMHVHGW
mmetsp:Transcript_127499/g.271846  ORF Transcript_127499/g.271846 Transcript_127499/m.271846 type:complete len:164 (-) Transcript_127499:66-557(-)